MMPSWKALILASLSASLLVVESALELSVSYLAPLQANLVSLVEYLLVRRKVKASAWVFYYVCE